MLKAITSNPVLSIAFHKEEPPAATQSRLFVLTKYKFERNRSSHLHRLFFGKDAAASVASIPNENKPADPEYFSSYE